MRHDEAETERQKRQREDSQHTYFVREQRVEDWEVALTNIPRPTLQVVAERGELRDHPRDPRPFIIRRIPPYGSPGFAEPNAMTSAPRWPEKHTTRRDRI